MKYIINFMSAFCIVENISPGFVQKLQIFTATWDMERGNERLQYRAFRLATLKREKKFCGRQYTGCKKSNTHQWSCCDFNGSYDRP